MDTIEKKISLKKRILAFFASIAVLAGGVVAGVQAAEGESGQVIVTSDQPGAKLQILNANGNVVVDNIVTNGQAQTFSVPAGKGYKLHEVAAPEGYELAADVQFEVLPTMTTSSSVIRPAASLPTSVSVYNDGLPTTGAYHMNDGTPIFCVDASDEYPPRGTYSAQQVNGVNGLSRDQLLRILYVGFVGNAKNYGSRVVAAEDYDAATQFWMATQYAVTSYTNPSLAEEYFGKYLGPNRSIANQIKAAANDSSIVVSEGSVAYLYKSSGNQPFVAASFPVVSQQTTYGEPTQISITHVKSTTPPDTPPAQGDGKVVIKKTDENGNVLTGAKFQIKNQNGKVVKDFTSTGNDEFTLSPGKYTLIEVEAPSGYEVQGDGKYSFEIKPGTVGAVSSGQTTSVVGAPTVGTIIRGTGSMEIAGGSALAFCVNPQATFLWETGGTYSYSVLGENAVDLNAFGTKNSAGARGWIASAPSNVGLTAAKMTQVKKVLWATYDFAMTGDERKDYTGIIAKELGTSSFKQAGVYEATQVAIAEIVSPGSVNWSKVGNNHTTGNVKALAQALIAGVQGQASYASYFFAYGGYSIVYLQSSDPSTQNLITPGSETVELTVVNTKEEEIDENPGSESYYPTLSIEAKKSLENGDINSTEYANAFEFTLTGSAGAPLPAKTTVKNNGEKVSFGSVTFKQAGTFTYTIKETKGTRDDIVYDESSKTVTVTVVEKKFGNDTYLEITNVSGKGVDYKVTNGAAPQLPDAPKNVIGYRKDNNGSNYGSNFGVKDSTGTTHPAFCLDYDDARPSLSGINYSLISDPSDIQRNAALLKKIAYFGYPYDGSGTLAAYVHQQNTFSGLSDEMLFRYATNAAIWKTLGAALPTSGSYSVAVNAIANKIIATAKANDIPSNVQVTMHVYSSGNNAYQRLITFDAVKKPQVVTVSVKEAFTNAVKKNPSIIRTLATADDLKVVNPAGSVTITDLVYYEDLDAGKTYTLKGKLVTKSSNGEKVVAEGTTTFVAVPGGTGVAGMTFTFDASKLAGDAVVAYEYLYLGDTLVDQHEDINDEGQTVDIVKPEVKTTATDKEDGDKVLAPEKTVTVLDRVEYKNLIPGKQYTLNGTLHIKDADETPVAVKSVKAVAAEGATIKNAAARTFVADKANGSVTLEFTFDASVLNGKQVVVFESLMYEDTEIATHADITDENQTVDITEKPAIGTTLTYGKDGKEVESDGLVEVVDTVSYSNLKGGKTYTLKGKLVKKADKSLIAISEATFTADKSGEGTTTMKFTFDASKLAGSAVVAYEYLFAGDVTGQNVDEQSEEYVTKHENINDAGQTVYVREKPEIEKYVNQNVHEEIDLSEVFTYDVLAYVTKDADKVIITDTLNSDLQFVSAVADVKVADLGTENNHTPYGTVAQVGTSVDNAVVAIKGQTLTVTIEPAEAYRGHWVKVTFDAKIADGKKIEDLQYATIVKNDPVITDEEHEGVPNTASYKVFVGNEGKYEDESNTVTVKPAKIGTLAAGTTGKTIFAEGNVTITDTVAYEGLEAGKTYTLKGILVKKSDGSTIATGEATFEAVAGGKGLAAMEFTFDASELAGDAVVAFEYLYSGDVVGNESVNEGSDEFVTKHEDINDEGQTVDIVKPEVETTASDAVDGDKFLDVTGDVVILDVVQFAGLIPGKEYTLDGTLHLKDANETPVDAEIVAAVDAEGATITDAEARTFVAEAANGSVTLAFKVDGTKLAGEQVVVFESLKYKGKEIAVHADITDEGQTVYFPEVGTTATADGDDGKVITIRLNETKNVTVTDEIAYSGFAPGKTFTVKGMLVGKTVDMPVVATNAATFTASDTGAGTWTLDFTFSTADLPTNVAELVVFEYVFEGDVVAQDIDLSAADEHDAFVAEHADIEDEGQTVKVTRTYPTIELATTATDAADGDKALEIGSDVIVKDVIEYKGLEIGATYTMRGKLVVKGTNGQDVVAKAEKVFTATTEDGTVDMLFSFNTANLEGKDLVVYEYLFKGDVLGDDSVTEDYAEASHADDSDAGQTVTVKKKVTPPPTPTPRESETPKPRVKLPVTGLPKTGGTVGISALAALLLLGGGMLLVRRRNED